MGDKWGVAVGERVRIGQKVRGGRRWTKGRVLSVYGKYLLVQLKKYRVTVADWELLDETVKLERVS